MSGRRFLSFSSLRHEKPGENAYPLFKLWVEIRERSWFLLRRHVCFLWVGSGFVRNLLGKLQFIFPGIQYLAADRCDLRTFHFPESVPVRFVKNHLGESLLFLRSGSDKQVQRSSIGLKGSMSLKGYFHSAQSPFKSMSPGNLLHFEF